MRVGRARWRRFDDGDLVHSGGHDRGGRPGPALAAVAARLGSPQINLVPRALFADVAMPDAARLIGVRTEHVRISKANGRAGAGRVTWVEHLGDQDHLHIRLGEHDFVTLADPESDLAVGDDVAIDFDNPLFFTESGQRVRT